MLGTRASFAQQLLQLVIHILPPPTNNNIHIIRHNLYMGPEAEAIEAAGKKLIATLADNKC